jgi:ABC-type multidrug transport system fused ATPase/permease subunit
MRTIDHSSTSVRPTIRLHSRLAAADSQSFAGIANRWLSLRVDAFGGLVALLAVVFITYTPSIDAALAGFILSFAVSFQDRLLWVVRLSADLEVQANSVERIQECEHLLQVLEGDALLTATRQCRPRHRPRVARRRQAAGNLADSGRIDRSQQAHSVLRARA